ncbi:Clp protease [Cellulophaga phage phi47:1]|uniref:head maturation protease n=2 Tax=root TaxID=1 RepID=UPI0002B79999|nr:head maturation protease [Cellulophaga phage phiSM]AGF91655.1 hypothetical protein CDPG_00051 [Cellulophaga phage phi47:1]AGO47746.1 Clp protease [Cellulophaga phage phi3ST:2]AGO49254.1 Clp protease [Cellulophaga phage phi38:2]AGO49334.1 Clp protease [Cellulophaga phage phi3:1]AGH07762.1 hypothetical protein CEPG_00014 [Cellulophaga phage phiSM]
MNLALAREIYGINPWCVDQTSFPALVSILENIKSGVALEIPTEKYNSIYTIDLLTSETKIVTETWQLRSEQDFNGIGLINLNGAITVSGGQSSYGVDHLSSQMSLMAKDSRIKSFLVLGDSGGGSSMAVEIMTDTIAEIRKTKKVYGLVKKGGMMASACFGIMSACKDGLWAESEMSIVGSAGTMIQFDGRAANTEEKGVKHIRIYAPESDHKNHGFEEALNKDNYAVLTDELLKPMNDRFLSLIESNRPQLKGTDFRNGHTVFAKDAIGTFIDGIKSFAEVIAIAATGKEAISNKNINVNTNTNNNMTKAEIKAQFPVIYSEIVNEGVEQRSDQVGSWLAHMESDPKSVIAGISSGKDITATERENFFVKQNSLNVLKKLESGSAPEVVTGEGAATIPDGKADGEEAISTLEKIGFNFEL